MKYKIVKVLFVGGTKDGLVLPVKIPILKNVPENPEELLIEPYDDNQLYRHNNPLPSLRYKFQFRRMLSNKKAIYIYKFAGRKNWPKTPIFLGWEKEQ